MFTVVVLGMLLTLGVPGFQQLIAGNRAATQSNELVTALAVARSEATRRGAAVTVCPSNDQATCAAGDDWAAGWIILDPAGDVLRVWPALAGNATMQGPESIVFIGNGSVEPAPTQDFFCLTVSADQVRTIEINRVGRARVERAAC
jgi:type IV fimbrial biogenesis protein FimT